MAAFARAVTSGISGTLSAVGDPNHTGRFKVAQIPSNPEPSNPGPEAHVHTQTRRTGETQSRGDSGFRDHPRDRGIPSGLDSELGR